MNDHLDSWSGCERHSEEPGRKTQGQCCGLRLYDKYDMSHSVNSLTLDFPRCPWCFSYSTNLCNLSLHRCHCCGTTCRWRTSSDGKWLGLGGWVTPSCMTMSNTDPIYSRGPLTSTVRLSMPDTDQGQQDLWVLVSVVCPMCVHMSSYRFYLECWGAAE